MSSLVIWPPTSKVMSFTGEGTFNVRLQYLEGMQFYSLQSHFHFDYINTSFPWRLISFVPINITKSTGWSELYWPTQPQLHVVDTLFNWSQFQPITWSLPCTVGLILLVCVCVCVYLTDEWHVGPYHSVSAVGCRSCASPNDLIDALLVNGRIALWERGRSAEVTLLVEVVLIN